MVYVDYPGETSLKQIYGTFNRAMLRLVPSLKPYADPLTNAMVEFYVKSQVCSKANFKKNKKISRYYTIFIRSLFPLCACFSVPLALMFEVAFILNGTTGVTKAVVCVILSVGWCI